ncbi:MAG: sugar ABC transporter permease [Clostridia bacterium]|nr:sugar ABC transporter permease [Clostridia bacterium]
MKRVLSNKWSIAVFVLPTVLFFTYIVIVPIFKSFYYSLLSEIPAKVGDQSEFVWFANYIKMFTPGRRNDFPGAVVNSLSYAALSVFIQLPFSLMIALILANGIKGESLYRNVFFIPVVISSVVISLLWQRIYKDLVPAVYEVLNLTVPKNGFLANKDTKLMAVFLPSLWQFVGYHMLLMYGALKSIPSDIIEAATVDGAGASRMALRIQIPMIKPMLKVCLSFSLIGSFKLFDTPWILLERANKQLPALSMYVEMFSNHKYSYASAQAMFIVFECLAFTVLLNILFKDRDDMVSRKGRRRHAA